tara:strand:- start:1408 stop:1671 length:264 start_codon:yes stop_codon:yes gene_type:complete
LPYLDGRLDVLGRSGSVMADLTDFELRLFEWIRQSDFESVAWSTKSAAKSFKCKENEIYDGVASLTKKLPNRIQIYYEDGNVHIAAE